MSENRANEQLNEQLRKAVVSLERERVQELAHQVIDGKLDAYDAINNGLTRGIEIVGDKFGRGEAFVPELLMAAKVVMAGIDILKPHITGSQTRQGLTFVIGTVKGDIHNIGKDIVILMMEVNGCRVHDLGVDVRDSVFLEKAEEFNADIVGLSALMSTTMVSMKSVMDLFERERPDREYKVIVGGAPLSQRWADDIGADGFAPNGAEAVKLAQRLIRIGKAN